MTAPGQTSSTPQNPSGAVLDTARQETGAVAGVATSAAGDVAATAREQVGNVVGETLDQARNVTAQLQDSARAQFDKQSETVAVQLRALSQQLRDGDTSGLAGKLMAEAGERLQGLSQYVDRVGPQGLVDDVRRYARRSPVSFCLTAALAGFVGGRLVKAAKAGAGAGTGDLPGRHAPTPPRVIPATGTPALGRPTEEVASVDVTSIDVTGVDVTGVGAPGAPVSGFDLTGTPVVPTRGFQP